MAEESKNTGNPQLINSFVKGMVKDVTDVFVPEGVWTNAINAINNAHNGEAGAIGNEQSNLYCSTVPYTVIGIINKYKTEWVVFSTNNKDSEIGIFDEATCSYVKKVNDKCLNFSTYNLITGGVKMNYDGSYSVYWQDNLNPDRVLNLDDDKIPYICYPKTINVNKVWKNYTITRQSAENPCGVSTNSGGSGVTNTVHNLGETYGVVSIDYNMLTIPDQLEVWFDAVPDVDPPTVTTGALVSGTGTLTFNKFTSSSTCYVRVTGNDNNTQWRYTVNCPIVTAETPPMPELSTGIFYTDVDNNVIELPFLSQGQSTTICALEGSIDTSLMPSDYTVSESGTICKEVNDTIEDPDACGEKCCTTNLDCDALRLQPLVKQPCITINKSKGSGQLNNGSYQAVIAYSENGIKLTDYSMPSNVQSLWDHTGMGGSLDINIDNLDENFDEYELVIIATINQQSVAKKIGYYSTSQTKVHLDLYNASLITVELSLIPLKTVVYEKSQKMFDINGYLIRSGLTTQPFFNYQPFANQIKCNWVAVQYPADYYWNGGNETGYYRDEVYPFFIRWVYKTGARSASFHIPGRQALSSDIALLPASNPDLIDTTRRKYWQVYDTSTITSIATEERADGGMIIARGDMAYWESTELYPNNHPEIWGDLCNKPIRHHKMPSNETIHIHNTTGEYINILGVEFSNIKHPVDENNNPILDIVGYEILRGSREGNRTILAKGLFNNMVQYDMQNTVTQKGLFQNYPYNDVTTTDPFLQSSNNLEVQNDIFSFHAPENNLVKPYMGSGGYVKLYTEELGLSKTYGVIPYKHPKFKFIHEDIFAASVVVATGLAILSLFGKQSKGTASTGLTRAYSEAWGAYQGVGFVGIGMVPYANFDSTITTNSEGGIATASGGVLTTTASAIVNAAAGGLVAGAVQVLSIVLETGLAIQASQMVFLQSLQSMLDIIYNIIDYKDHVVQLNSHAFYNSFSNVVNSETPSLLKPSITRPVVPQGARYVSSGLQDFNATQRINNLNRNKFLAVQTSSDVPFTYNTDNSKKLLVDTDNISKIYTANTASYYGAIKVDYENQYGQLYSIVQIPVNSCVYDTISDVTTVSKTSQIFGGDIYINRYTEKNSYYFYNTWLIDVPNGTEWNYQNYINGPIPTYWLDSTLYRAPHFDISVDWDIIPEFSFNTPADYYNFHGYNAVGSPVRSSFKNAWMYLSFNSVRDFFTESELNIAFRDYGEEPWEKFYDPVGNSFTDLDTMFRSDIITKPIYYEYDLSLSASKLYSNFASWASLLPRDYDPTLYSTYFEHYPRRLVYSLQQQEGLKRDNWRNYLQNNYRDFDGIVSTIKSLNAQGAVILFEDMEPTQFVGVDTFESQGGVKYTIGDSGLFQQNMQSIVNADDAFAYGTCISSKSAVNTPYGLFWVSQQTGKIISYSGGGIQEISKDGMKYWFLENLPSKLLQKYPDFKLYDNVVEGISVQAIFDSQYDLLYFTKKDFLPKPEFDEIIDCLEYVEGEGYFINQSKCSGQGSAKSCPPGYTMVFGECQKTIVTKICNDGYTYDSDTNTCVSATDSVPANACPEGCVADYDLNTCTCIDTVGYNTTPVLTPIKIEDYMEPVNWTISYDPKLKMWLSFHDWHPEWLIPSYNHFLTIKSEDITTPLCPEGYTYDPTLLKCVQSNFNSQPANVVITEVTSTITDSTSQCLMDIVIAMDYSGSTITTPSIIAAQRQFVHEFLSDPVIVAGMQAGRIQIGFTKWAGTTSVNEMLPNGFSMSNTITVSEVDAYYSSTPSGATNICTGMAHAHSVLTDKTASELGDRSSSPNFRNIMLFMTDANDTDIVTCYLQPGTSEVGCQYQNLPQYDVYSVFCSADNPNPPAPHLLSAISCSTPSKQFIMVADNSYTNYTSTYIANQIAGVICGSTETQCNCPEGYTLIGECDSENPPICRKVECECPTFEIGDCGTNVEVTTIGQCDDVLYAGQPGYVNPNPLICNSSVFLTKEPSYRVGKIWRHNVRTDSFVNYYGQDYPWEVEFPVVTPNTITTIRSLEYTLDVYKYFNNGKDFNHILDENFDRAIIYNSEQNSGLLKLNLKPKNDPFSLLSYPVTNAFDTDIHYSKEENKFRFNQFYDVTNDRGEYSGNTIPMWITQPDGYHKIFNVPYYNFNKSPLQHKKFRHYGNKVILRKNISNDKKMILKFVNNKYLISPR